MHLRLSVKGFRDLLKELSVLNGLVWKGFLEEVRIRQSPAEQSINIC